jgi:hypothetical protein
MVNIFQCKNEYFSDLTLNQHLTMANAQACVHALVFHDFINIGSVEYINFNWEDTLHVIFYS